jgi:hypothetical protein
MNRARICYRHHGSSLSRHLLRVAAASLLAGAALSQACTYGLQRVWVPSDIATKSERYSVSGHVRLLRGKVAFGPYETVNARVAPLSGIESDATILNAQKERSASRQEGSFQLSVPDGTQFSGRCVRSRNSESQHELWLRSHNGGDLHLHDQVVNTEWHYIYRCTLKSPQGSAMELVIEDGIPEVRGSAHALQLVSIRRAENQAEHEEHGSAHGYLIKDGAQTVAAVDLSEHLESVRLRSDLPQAFKNELAAICMALLLPRDML